MASPPSIAYREAPPRSFGEWDPRLLEAAIQMADGGSLRLAADLCERLLADDRVQGVLSTRVRGLLRLPIRFELDEDEEETPEEAALREDFWRAFPEDDLTQLCSWGVLLGVGVGEQVWEERHGRVLPRLKVWHPRWLRWDWHSREWRLAVDGGAEVTVTPGDGKWVLYTPYGENRPWAHASWKACGLAWLVKRFAVRDGARHFEAHGNPVKVGTAPAGAKAETRREFAADLQRLVGGGAIALPPEYDFKFVEAVGRSGDIFLGWVGWADKAIAVTIAGQNLTSEVTGGSFAAAQVHQTIAHHYVESDEQTLSTTLHDQSLIWWAEFNFGDTDRAPWVRWDTTPPEDLKSKAETLRTVGEAAAQLTTAGVKVDTVALARQFGIPVEEDDEDEATGQLFQYHFEFGIITINEARARLGLPPIEGGDEPPMRADEGAMMDPADAASLLRAMKAERQALRRGDRSGVVALRARQTQIVALGPVVETTATTGPATSRTNGWRRTVALASGREGPQSFQDGAEFAATLAENTRNAAADLMAADVKAIRKLIEDATDAEALRKALVTHYRGMDPAALAEVVRRSLLMAELSGRLEVTEEVTDATAAAE